MTAEQIQMIAKAATDSYFSNLSPDAKLLVMSDSAGYVREYAKFYENAIVEVMKYEREKNKSDQQRFEQFGFGNEESENAKSFK